MVSESERLVAMLIRHGWDPVNAACRPVFKPSEMKKLEAWAEGMRLWEAP
jgi:hypothetical protein